jgi:hypothetical protein
MPDNRPHLIEKIDLNAPIDVLRRTLVAGTDALLRLRITRGPSPENTTGASIELHLSGDDDGTPWAQTCSGEAEDEAAGWWKIEIPAAKLNLVGDIDGQILLTDANTKESCSQLLRLKVVEKLTGGATPPPGSEINWSEYTGYTDTATKGPVRPHSGTLEVKATNADGSISIGVKDGLYDPAGAAAAAQAAAEAASLPVGGTAADVNPAGTSIAAALGGKVAKTGDTMSGDLVTTRRLIMKRGGSLDPLSNELVFQDESGNVLFKLRQSTIPGTESVVIERTATSASGDLFIRPRVTGAPSGNLILCSQGGKTVANGGIDVDILRALTAAGLALQDSAGAEHALLTSTGLRIRPRIVSSSITAELDGVYHGTAAATYTDPTPADGRGYLVRVVNGTQTVGGTAYAAEGTVIFREYHSGAWRNRVLFGGADAAGVRATIGAAALTPTVNAQTGTTYTFAATDAGGIVTATNGSAITHTIPPNSSVPMPVGTIINDVQLGAGVLTIEGGTGVAVNGVSEGAVSIGARYQGATCLKIATDTWIISGAIS